MDAASATLGEPVAGSEPTTPGTPQRRGLAAVARIAPFLLLGPVTGPLAAGVFFNFREGRPVLGSLYAIALVEMIFYIPFMTATLSWRLAAIGLRHL